MGGGSWSTDAYDARSLAKAAAGKSTFDHSDAIRSGQKAAAVHDLLNPRILAGDKSPHAGQVMRECMVSDEHPNPTPIAVLLDVTGSNYQAAVTVHSKLPNLQGALQRKGYVDDPQILVGAIGDAFSDRVPLQIGQFESDNRLDEQIEAMYLEGNGGGQVHETYEIGAYFMARHTYLEPLERDGKKGYLFFIGDEMPYESIHTGDFGYARHTIESLTGDKLEEPISTEAIFAELKEKYEVFFLFQRQGAYPEDRILPAWKKLLGERALVLDDPNAVAETIALTLAVLEGGLTLDDGLDDLKDAGMDASAVQAAGKALAVVGSGRAAVATTSGELPGIDNGDSGAERL